jgi:hypothetical protein
MEPELPRLFAAPRGSSMRFAGRRGRFARRCGIRRAITPDCRAFPNDAASFATNDLTRMARGPCFGLHPRGFPTAVGAGPAQDLSMIPGDCLITYDYQRVIDHADSASRTPGGSRLLDNKSEMLLDAAGFEPVDIDVLAFGLPSGRTLTSMLLLERRDGPRPSPAAGTAACLQSNAHDD